MLKSIEIEEGQLQKKIYIFNMGVQFFSKKAQ